MIVLKPKFLETNLDSIKILQNNTNLSCKLIKINLDKIQDFNNYLCNRIHDL